MKNSFSITIKFKNEKTLEFVLRTDVDDIREKIAHALAKESIVYIGDYFFVTSEILWIKVEGGQTESENTEHSG